MITLLPGFIAIKDPRAILLPACKIFNKERELL